MATYPTKDSLIDMGRRFYSYALVRQGISTTSASSALAKGGTADLTIRLCAELCVPAYALTEVKEDATFPDSATGDDLTRAYGVYGKSRSAGERATGNAIVSATSAATFNVGDVAVANKNGRRYQVVSGGAYNDGDTIPLISEDVGPSMNLPEGAVLKWVSPPSGSLATCTVDSDGITGGESADTDASVRRKLLKLLREPQNGGSWAHVRQWLEDANANVENAFVYCAPQGPGTTHAAFTIEGNADNAYQRAASSALVTTVNDYVLTQYPEHSDLTLTTVEHEDLSLALRLTLPEPLLAGGLGGGWVDQLSGTIQRWPTILASGLPVKVSVVTDSTTFTVDATATPVVGASVDFFDSTNRTFLRAKILTKSGTSGAYVITVDTALPTILVGDYLCPACEQSNEYLRIIQEEIAKLGPGEKTTDATVLARAFRHPRSGEDSPSGVDSRLLKEMFVQRAEVTALRFSAINLSATPTYPVEPSVPADISDPPNIWRLKRLAFYP